MTIIHDINAFIKASQLVNDGYSVIPIGTDKKPLIPSWREYQNRQPTSTELARWKEQYPNAGIAIITGARFKLIVVDVDVKHEDRNGLDSIKKYALHLPPTYIVRTGSGGYHYYYRWPADLPAPTKTDVYAGIDLRGDGGYVVAPPSRNEHGAYEATNSIEDIADAPVWLIDLAKQRGENSGKWQKGVAGVTEGSRNDSAASMAGKLLVSFKPDEWDELAWPLLTAWNDRNIPPLPERELRAVFESIKQKAAKNSQKTGREPLAQKVIAAVLEQEPKLFVDQYGESYAHIQTEGHAETLPMRGRKFALWTRKLFWEGADRTIGQDTLTTAIATLEGKATFEGETVHLHNRVAKHSESYWYDLTDPAWSAIRVTESGWEQVASPPILFRREAHQKAQCIPVGSGDIRLLLPFLNIPSEAHRTLLLVYIVSCFVPDIPHPIPVIHGDHGSAKSTLLRMMRRIIDPSETELLSLPKPDEAIQQLAHHWTPYYDNVRNLSDASSDILCRAVTGEGSTKRALYTNDEDKIFAYRRCPALNGINVAAQAADLLDRSILIRLERIPPDARRDEKSLWAEFDDALPKILGGVFNVLTKAIASRPSVKLDLLPRMADFALWGFAIAEAMGLKGADFVSAYEDNVRERNEEVLSGNLIASCIVALAEHETHWEGTPSELYERLEKIADELNIKTTSRGWPKAANAMSRRLNEVRTNLADAGITVEISRDRKRIVTIKKAMQDDEMVSVEECFRYDGSDDNDGLTNF